MPEPIELWRVAASQEDRGLIDDMCNGLRTFADGAVDEPEEVVALAIAGAEAAEGLEAALDIEWALYTPKQAAVVASALFTQIEAAAAAMDKLSEYLDVMAERGDITEPGPDFEAVGDAALVGEAQRRLATSAYEADCAVTADRVAAVDILAATPYFGTMPTSPHETLVAVAGLAGGEGKLLTHEHLRDDSELAQAEENGFGCGCWVEIADRSGAVWRFYRVDSPWCLVPADGQGERVELPLYEADAHPRHLWALISQELGLTR